MHFIIRTNQVCYLYRLLLIFHHLIRQGRTSTAGHSLILITLISFTNPQITYAQSQCGKIFRGDASDFNTEVPTVVPEWWDNNLGTEPVVLPGYSPVTAVNNNLELYQREYKWGKNYLPQTINSRGTALVDRMSLVARINGKIIELAPNNVQMIENHGVSVTVLSTGEPIPGLKVRISTTVEYDGVATSQIQLTPTQPVTLESLDYEALVVDSPTMEVISFKAEQIRKQKDRHDMVKLPFAGDFLNVVGFADGNRSFWWFADNAKGWIWNGSTVTEIARKNGKIRLRQRLIGDSWTISEPMSFNINFLATPARDLGSDWRSKRVIHGVPSEKQVALGGKFKLWWTDALAHDAFPYTYYPNETIKRVTLDDRTAYPGAEHNARLIQTDKVKYGSYWIPYFSAHALSKLDPVLETFKSSWEIHPPKQFNEVVGPYTRIYGKPVLTHQAKSYSDYLLWQLNDAIDRIGIEGIYLDHGPPHDSCNPRNGGWIDSNGRLQPSLDILGLRDFLKRLHTLFVSKDKAGYIFIHDSNREIIPAYTFAYATVDGEQYRSGRVRDNDYLRAITLNEFRTRFSPGQYGVLTVWLPTAWTYHNADKKWSNSENQRSAYRRIMSLALLHDVANWPIGSHEEERRTLITALDLFGIDNAEYIGYWDPHIAVSADNPGIKISAYRHRGSGNYMFIAANTTDTPINTVITFELSQLGFEENGGKLLPENKQPIALSPNNRSHRLQVPAKDFRWLTLKHNM